MKIWGSCSLDKRLMEGAKRGNLRWREGVDFNGVWIVLVPEELMALDGFLWGTKGCKVRREGGGFLEESQSSFCHMIVSIPLPLTCDGFIRSL